MKDKTMKNIQVINDSDNCTYSIFAATDEEFAAIFPDGADIEFAEDFFERVGEDRGIEITKEIWRRPVKKSDVRGVHGTLFYHLLYKERYYPTRKESEFVPLGTDFAKPPENAYDQNGLKAPGLPGEDVGYIPPNGGPSWVPNPNPERGGSEHGWLDEKGRVWCPTGQGNRAHGAPHWDVQIPRSGDQQDVFPRKQ